MDNTSLYTLRSSNYEYARPGYPDALYDYLYEYVSLSSVITDIGSGTGKFSEGLLRRGNIVYCVEPNDEMRGIAEKKLSDYPGFRSIKGTEAHTGINQTVDYITAAQAFHWFDEDRFRSECSRLLNIDTDELYQRVFLIWNLRVPSSDITNACREVFRKYCPKFVDFNIGIGEDAPVILSFFPNGYEKRIFRNDLTYDRGVNAMNTEDLLFGKTVLY